MASKIPPKARITTRQTYYTKGESEKEIKTTGFRSHIAEPGHAATILERNQAYHEEKIVKPRSTFIRSGGYTPGLYTGKCEPQHKELTTNHTVGSLHETKLIKSREFAE